MITYLQHPIHGVKVATSDMEVDNDTRNGWKKFDPTAPKAPAPTPAAVEVKVEPVVEPVVEPKAEMVAETPEVPNALGFTRRNRRSREG